MTPSEVLKMAADKGAKVFDLRFLDFPGLWQHMTHPISELTEDAFNEGFGFDGSSIRGWQAIDASDMLVMPDPTTARMDPFMKEPTLVMICDIVDPLTLEQLSQQFGISRERVRQIEVRAFEKLQKSMRTAAIEERLIN